MSSWSAGRRRAWQNCSARAGHALVPVDSIPHIPPPGLTLVQGVMEEGWKLERRSNGARRGTGDERIDEDAPPAPALWFLTDAELFGWGKPKPRRPQRPRAVAPEVFFADVQPGDFVVHLEHGIGLFKGLIKMPVDGVDREYLQVEYAQGDQLYVPVHQADRLARYVGAGEAAPNLHRLGTSDWEQVKARARRAVAEIADELLELYAAREVVEGHAFSPDATWQQELEASFPYVETEDQLVAIESVKHDMEQPRPMDRLICGDVGLWQDRGRAARCVQGRHGRQAGRDPGADHGPRAAALHQLQPASRRVPRHRRDALSLPDVVRSRTASFPGWRTASVDLVIGTHRLLSNDVCVQRPGPADRRRRAALRRRPQGEDQAAAHRGGRADSDRDADPAHPAHEPDRRARPEHDRHAARRTAADQDVRGRLRRRRSCARPSCARSIATGRSISCTTGCRASSRSRRRSSKIVPEARIAIAHGQMPEKELSAVMLAFAEGDYDVLVCTTIIESGLDIPNANTIIINRADTFGLAQLYQLRGRVGRSAVRAYAYLLVDKYKALSEDARRRLDAIQEASDLGAGFRIAMRDLEIRGAGELLGSRQHGHIAAVGFDLYTRLLAQAVSEARERAGGPARPPRDDDEAERQSEAAGPSGARNVLEDPLAPTAQLDLNLPARIPEEYVPEGALRLQLYRRLAGLTSLEAVDEIAQEFADRFGPVPEEVKNLLYVVGVKVRAVNAGVEAIGMEEGQILIKCACLETMDRAKLQERLKAQGVPGRIARRAIWMEMREAASPAGVSGWQRDLIKALDSMRAVAEADGRLAA